ncbi:MAG: alginate lyase family protein [Deltaproteobacteria bacterium]
MSQHITIASIVIALGMTQASASFAAECAAVIDPVVSVSHGSRYTDDSKTRSDFDAENEAEIDKALGPVDTFIIDLARLSNRALSDIAKDKPDSARESADCLLDAVALWAKADAISELGTMNAELSVPSRLGGIAIAFANTKALASDNPERKAVIDAWLAARATATMAFFDGPDVPPRAGRNNLRSWADLAVLSIGLSLEDDAMIAWARASVGETICSSLPDGALPLEMQRGPLSLHYQIHAVTPLVTIAALLQDAGVPLTPDCATDLSRIVAFTLDAIADPTLVEAHAGVAQDFKPGPDGLKPSEAAWLAPWLSLETSPEAQALAVKFPALANSKLGGDLTLIWPMASDK